MQQKPLSETTSRPLPFRPYEESRLIPNVVVDGAPNEGTVLTLTHWPGIAQPDGLSDAEGGADLSAELAFHHLDRPVPHEPAEGVTNNHFDQDGLVSIFALSEPEAAIAHRERLIDLAAAGDFATYRFRESARASMALWTFGHPDRSPMSSDLSGLPYADQCALLYQETLPLLVPLLTDPDRFRPLWEEEDAALDASERAIRDGTVTIEERTDVDLAVVTIPSTSQTGGGHRFGSGGDQLAAIHPMAINNASACLRQLIVTGRRYRYVDRYETWVQLGSRRPLPRVDLDPLAVRLSDRDQAGGWRSTAPSTLSPQLWSPEESALDPTLVIDEVCAHLRSAPPAWDPYAPEPGAPT